MYSCSRCSQCIARGVSTLILADYARRSGAELVSLGHEMIYQERVRALLDEFSLSKHVDLFCRVFSHTSVQASAGGSN